MKITVALNQKSIKEAIKRLENAKKQLNNEMLKEFYLKCYEYFVGRANYVYLAQSDISDLVIAEIQSSWTYDLIPNGIKITNFADKAVYVEFGVGVVGEENKHSNADNAGYEYNISSSKKLADGSWIFRAYEDELDIPQSAIVASNYTANGRLRILTLGTKGVMYAFNALEDLRLEMPKIWKEIKVKYWG